MDYRAIELRQRIVAIKRARSQRLAAQQQERRVEVEREEERLRKRRDGYWVDKEAGVYMEPYSDVPTTLKVGCCHCRTPQYGRVIRHQAGKDTCGVCGTPFWAITRQHLAEYELMKGN